MPSYIKIANIVNVTELRLLRLDELSKRTTFRESYALQPQKSRRAPTFHRKPFYETRCFSLTTQQDLEEWREDIENLK